MVVSRSQMLAILSQEKLDGWEVMYTIPIQNLYTTIGLNRIGSANISSDGSIQVFIPGNASSSNTTVGSEDVFEIGLFRFDLPEPCVRCSYPYADPDRVDREV